MSNCGYSNNSSQNFVLQNLNRFLEEEGYRVQPLAKKLNMSTSEFYAHLQGKNASTFGQFASELALVLGYHETYFLNIDFSQATNEKENTQITNPKGNLSEIGKTGLDQIGKLCDLIDVYFL